jgi:hypothetical protein
MITRHVTPRAAHPCQSGGRQSTQTRERRARRNQFEGGTGVGGGRRGERAGRRLSGGAAAGCPRRVSLAGAATVACRHISVQRPPPALLLPAPISQHVSRPRPHPRLPPWLQRPPRRLRRDGCASQEAGARGVAELQR